MDSRQFAHWFRASSPYIREHRHKTFVTVLSGAVLHGSHLPSIVQDLALLNVLDIRLLLVLDSNETRTNPIVTEPELINELEVMEMFAITWNTFHDGCTREPIPTSPYSRGEWQFVSARPLGVIKGVDCDFAGSVRRIYHQEIASLLELGNVVLVTPFGYSMT